MMARGKQKLGIMALLLAMLLVVSACGTNNGASNEPANNDGAAQTGNEGANGNGQAGNSSGEEQAEGGAPLSEPETRVVVDEFGEVEVPTHPQRVVGVYMEDYLAALGVTPVAQWYHPLWGTQEYLNLDAPLFDITGSLEALLAYDPDLIIVDGAVDAIKYEEYSKIAPTYRLPENVLQDAKQVLTVVADVLNMQDHAAAVLEAYEQKVADVKAQLQATVGDETVAVIRVNTGDKTIALFGQKNRYTGVIYNEFGLTPHPLAANMEAFQEVLSEEAFASLDADHIIVFPSNGNWDSPENKDAFTLLDSPLWKSVPAFQNGHVYKMERSHWQSGAITANNMKLDDLLQQVAK